MPHKNTGQKDGLQSIVIRQIARELSFNTRVIICPTVRESDGLAMSSRNAYLSTPERKLAPIVYQTLQLVEKLYNEGERSSSRLKEAAIAFVAQQNSRTVSVRLEYISISSAHNGQEVADGEALPSQLLVSVAIKFPSTRLIDNILLGS